MFDGGVTTNSISLPDNEDECLLSTHTLSMRRAVKYCTEQMQQTALKDSIGHCTSRPFIDKRPNHKRLSSNWDESFIIPTIRDHAMPTPHNFRRDFLIANRPCLISDSEWIHRYFGRVLRLWNTHQDTAIHREWFKQHVGLDSFVPVRVQSHIAPTIDTEGRATECDTKLMRLADWFRILDQDDSLTHAKRMYYLKDWHLQLRLSESLYTVPDHFAGDLLNGFFLKFTDGDYRFTYWGPAGSTTPIHSDVLNSFSWSLNVHGTKEWTFYHPVGSQTLIIRQHRGECMFVPAGWKHSVVNLEETLSINHNWITEANIDLTWECILSESNAVEDELKAWGNIDWESRESMLRGCVGLDITAFLLMLLVGITDKFQEREDDATCALCKMIRKVLSHDHLSIMKRLEACLACTESATAMWRTLKQVEQRIQAE